MDLTPVSTLWWVFCVHPFPQPSQFWGPNRQNCTKQNPVRIHGSAPRFKTPLTTSPGHHSKQPDSNHPNIPKTPDTASTARNCLSKACDQGTQRTEPKAQRVRQTVAERPRPVPHADERNARGTQKGPSGPFYICEHCRTRTREGLPAKEEVLGELPTPVSVS